MSQLWMLDLLLALPIKQKIEWEKKDGELTSMLKLGDCVTIVLSGERSGASGIEGSVFSFIPEMLFSIACISVSEVI